MRPNGTHGQKNIFTALRDPFFRMLWIANVASLVGSWMHETATAWLMTSMTVSPIMVALLQTSMTLPFFLMHCLRVRSPISSTGEKFSSSPRSSCFSRRLRWEFLP